MEKLFRNSEHIEDAKSATHVVFYHRADMDGRLSGAILRIALEEHSPCMLGLNYEDTGAKDILRFFPKMKHLYLVDYSLPAATMGVLIAHKVHIVLLDHHKTAIDDVQRARDMPVSFLPSPMFESHARTDHSGAWITWDYACKIRNPNPQNLDRRFNPRTIPNVVALVSTYDTWDNAAKSWQDALYLNSGLYFDRDTSVYSPLWEALLFGVAKEDLLAFIIDEGKFVERVRENAATVDSNSYGGTLTWRGITVLALNASGNSRTAEPAFDPSIHDAIMLYRWSPTIKSWKVSLYRSTNGSKDIDLSVHAKAFGGGGHAGACGFTVDKLPFKLEDITPLKR